MRRKPEENFYLFTMPAPQLRRLCGVYRRTTQRGRGTEDLGIQRRHDERRSQEIAEFVRYGYPWCDLPTARRSSEEFNDLRKPGWLPTAIVVNILTAEDERRGKAVDDGDMVTVSESKADIATIALPAGCVKHEWQPKGIPPLEIIDGQHRLWAFEEQELDGAFELPVVAFVGLDRSWQAYLFYIINIKPKRINASLAFDLYPLLRTEDWLERFEGHVIYRETRAQELVDLLYSHPESPWHRWINMLGDPGQRQRMVSQSAWVRSLLATYVKSWEGRGVRGIGGLFGSRVGEDNQVLPWTRSQQAAFLIVVGQLLGKAVKRRQHEWAGKLREQATAETSDRDSAFFGNHSLLNQDQGIRAVLHITNDLCYLKADDLGLGAWGVDGSLDESGEDQVTNSVRSLRKHQQILNFLQELAQEMAAYDWRASSAPSLTDQDKTLKGAFRGSGGYRELRRHVLIHLSKASWPHAKLAKKVITLLGM
jgi:hypothetical protein